MQGNYPYLFTSERLGFRAWNTSDIPLMAAINADPAVMEFFPAIQSLQQTEAFIERVHQSITANGFGYFAVDRLDTGAFIGFIGLMEKTFEAAFTPCIDIGWRLSRQHWNNGFATEGAKRCLDYAFNDLHLLKVYCMAPVINKKSEAVMQKIGMRKAGHFNHPLLKGDARLEDCVLYEMTNDKASS